MIWGEESIGARIQRLRIERNLSQKELGQSPGVDLSERAINQIENDVINVSTHRDYAERIANALGISVGYLLRSETPAEKATKAELNLMVVDGILRESEVPDVYDMADVRLRANARIPLSRLELNALVEVYRGR